MFLYRLSSIYRCDMLRIKLAEKNFTVSRKEHISVDSVQNTSHFIRLVAEFLLRNSRFNPKLIHLGTVRKKMGL